ncbi:hypothetical protein BJV74DRAFT_890154 [Russula compacta]|nr:hypothetical protein BJV74DRAFT_890154 [Russula compacta]
MDNFIVSFMVSVYTLPTTWNKYCLHALFRAGIQTPADNLDAESGQQSHNHTDVLWEQYSLRVLWNDYGIMGGIIPFTAEFPHTDTHELLCLDLLHQVIKGTFKDHLITWVGKYLDLAHGSTAAAAIMADIDNQ